MYKSLHTFILIIIVKHVVLMSNADNSIDPIFNSENDHKWTKNDSNILENDQNLFQSNAIGMRKKCFHNKQSERYILSIINDVDVNPIKRHSNAYSPRADQTSLVIVFDSTASMSSSLKELRSNARNIINKFSSKANNPIYNYIFVPFRDPDIGPELVTIERTKLLEILDGLDIYGGGDCPEKTLSGISLALKYALPRSFVYIFTDATAIDYELEDTVIEQIQQKQATLNFLVTSDCGESSSPGYKIFETLAEASNGNVYRVRVHDMTSILNDIDDKLDKRNTLLASAHSSTAGSNKISVAIDVKIDEFNVIVTGTRPQIKIIDPLNEIYTNFTEKLNLNEVKIVNVQRPMPGKWAIQTNVQSPNTVKLTGISKIIFEFGFSTSQPKSILETSFGPLNGSTNILTIKPSTDVNLTEAHLNGERHSIILPLKKIESNESNEILYETAPFTVMNEPFKIAIKGLDEDGNDIHRILSTIIKARNDVPPNVFLAQTEIISNEDESISISCNVDSLTKVNITIEHDGHQLNEWHSNQSTSVEHKIDSISSSNEGIYKCLASNIYGTSERSLKLTVLSQPLTVIIPQSEYSKAENQTRFEIPCIISPKSKSQIATLNWLFGGSEITANEDVYEINNTSLIIHQLSKEHTGIYMCVATLDNEEQTASTFLRVMFSPRISEPNFEEMNIEYGETLYISCTVSAVPDAKLEWKYHSATENTTIATDQNFIIIDKFAYANEGFYICEANNGIGSMIERKIKVHGVSNQAPEIYKIENIEVIVLTMGDDLKLNCHCKMCEPLTELMWIHEVNDINKSETGNLINDIWSNQIDFSLNLNNVTTNDAGLYTCYMKNDFGSDTYVQEVIIKIPPQTMESIVYSECFQKVESMAIIYPTDSKPTTTTSANLFGCHTLNRPKNFTIIVIEEDPNLYGDGTIVSLNATEKSNQMFIENVQTFSNCTLSSLRAPDITKLISDTEIMWDTDMKNDYSGIYECQLASNTSFAGSAFVLTIFVKPKAAESEKVFEVKSNEQQLLVCSPASKDVRGNALSDNQTDETREKYECEWFHSNEKNKNFTLISNDPPMVSVRSPEYIKVIRGDNITIYCSVIGNPKPELYWLDGNEKITTTNRFHLNTENVTFHTKNVTCVGENVFGSDIRTVSIQVISIPSEMYELPVNSYADVLMGEDYSIECPFKDFDRIIWSKDEINMENQTNILNFSNINLDNNGTYRCNASNLAGSRQFNHTIFVNFPSQISINEKDWNASIVDVVSSNHFEWKCEATGYPLPKIKWEHDSIEVSPNGTLLIKDVLNLNAGVYICIAENKHGIDHKYIELNVLYAPTYDNNTEQIIDIHQNETISLNCSMDANPIPEYTWFKNGFELSGLNDDFMEIHRANITDDGIYECLVNNSIGNNIVKFHVHIRAGATIVYMSENQTIGSMEKLILTCEANGNPVPYLTWARNHKIMMSTIKTHFQSKANDSVSRFYLTENGIVSNDKQQMKLMGEIVYDLENHVKMSLYRNVSYKNIESFTCLATNAYGQEKRTIYIETTSSPQFQSDSEPISTIDVLNGFPIVLNCDVTGYPAPNIQWQKDNVTITSDSVNIILSNNQKHLHIVFTTQDDNGLYKCIAENSMGKNERYFILNVLIPPQLKSDNDELSETVFVIAGENVTLICPIAGNPLPIINWIEIDLNDDAQKSFLEITNSTLYIEEIQNSTIFRCFANNTLGDLDYSFKVSVQRPPILIGSTLENQTLDINDNFLLDCAIQAEPQPNFSWFKDGNLLVNHTQSYGKIANHTFLSANRRYLRVFNSQPDAFGEYSCIASNPLGSIQRKFSIIFNPYWDEWSAWSICSKNCGKGNQMRKRFCRTMRPDQLCNGKSVETKMCFIKPCIVNEYGPWSNWSVCSQTCGPGQQYRYRKCKSEGKLCIGDSNIEVRECMLDSCYDEYYYLSDKSKYTPLLTIVKPPIDDDYHGRQSKNRGRSLEGPNYDENSLKNITRTERVMNLIPMDKGVAHVPVNQKSNESRKRNRKQSYQVA